MSRAVSVRRTAIGMFAVLGAVSVLAMPLSSAQPDPEPVPATDAPTTAAADAPAPVDDCNASTLAKTISSTTASLSEYFAAHPDANQALIDITRQPAFVAVGQVDGYFAEHPQQADEIRAINAPLADFKNRCGLQVSPTDALTVLADL